MGYETLEIEQEGVVLRVWLNRPHRRNAVDSRMLVEIEDLFRSLERDHSTRVIVLGGRGPTFCAGADRKTARESDLDPAAGPKERRWRMQAGRRACRAIEECEVVTIARIQGHAIGGGCCLALSCDFRLASRDAIFRVPEVELGVPLTWAGVPRLLHEVGAARTREILLLCEDLAGEKLEHWGLVHRRVEESELDAEVSRWTAAVLERSELAVHMTKTQLRGYSRLFALGDASETDGDLISVAYTAGDAKSRFDG